MNAEENRLEESGRRKAHWKRWGPYLSERQWGTVREDYSPYGTAWDFFPHDHARSQRLSLCRPKHNFARSLHLLSREANLE